MLNRTRGFTLIEILVVVLIIGILATMFGLSIGNRSLDERIRTEAQRLEQVLKLASEEAQAKGMLVGFRYTREGYELLGLNQDGGWAPFEGNGPLRARELGVPFELQLKVEGRAVPPGISREFFEENQPIEPQFLLLSSGELMPFLLWVNAERQRAGGFLIEGGMTGEIALTPWSEEQWSERKRPETGKRK